jgi:hypothetical protein
MGRRGGAKLREAFCRRAEAISRAEATWRAGAAWGAAGASSAEGPPACRTETSIVAKGVT